MPVMDGTEFLRWLRCSDHAHIPVVLMTAGHKGTLACQQLGVQGYLAKPFDLADLQGFVARWVEGSDGTAAEVVH